MRCRCDGLSACLVHTKELKELFTAIHWSNTAETWRRLNGFGTWLGNTPDLSCLRHSYDWRISCPRLKPGAIGLSPLRGSDALLGLASSRRGHRADQANATLPTEIGAAGESAAVQLGVPIAIFIFAIQAEGMAGEARPPPPGGVAAAERRRVRNGRRTQRKAELGG